MRKVTFSHLTMMGDVLKHVATYRMTMQNSIVHSKYHN